MAMSTSNAAAVRLKNLFNDPRVFSTLLVYLNGLPTVTGKRKKKVKPDYAHLAPFAALALTARPVARALLRPDARVWSWMWTVYLRHKSHRTLPMYAVLNAFIRALPAYLNRRVPRDAAAKERITTHLKSTGNTTPWRQVDWLTYIEIPVYDALKELNSAEFDLASHDMETVNKRDTIVSENQTCLESYRRIHAVRVAALKRMESTLDSVRELAISTREITVVDGEFMWSRDGVTRGPLRAHDMRRLFNRGVLDGALIWVSGCRYRRQKHRLYHYVRGYGTDPFKNETALHVLNDAYMIDAEAGTKARLAEFETRAAKKRAAIMARVEAAREAIPLARERLLRLRRSVVGIKPYDVPALTKAFKKARKAAASS